jgi:hypothetical protein
VTRHRYAKSATLSRGAEIDSLSTALVADAVAAARAADVVVAVVGDSASSCGEGDDRDSLDPAGSQLALLQALATVGKPLVVVVVGCRAVTFGPSNNLLSNISALLMAWRPGSEGGRAVVDLLFGAAEPSGRLGQNWLRSPSQVGSCANPWFQQRRSDVTSSDGVDGAEGRRYASYTHSSQPSTPLFHFGFGLSLAKHSLSELTAEVQWPVTPGGGGAVVVALASVTLAETSGRTAPAVIQLYVQDPVGVLHRARPWKRLVGFGKHMVAGGGSMRVTIPILLDDLAFPGDDMAMALHAGACGLALVVTVLVDNWVVAGGCEMTDGGRGRLLSTQGTHNSDNLAHCVARLWSLLTCCDFFCFICPTQQHTEAVSRSFFLCVGVLTLSCVRLTQNITLQYTYSHFQGSTSPRSKFNTDSRLNLSSVSPNRQLHAVGGVLE